MPPPNPFRMFPNVLTDEAKKQLEKQKAKPKPETISMDNDEITGNVKITEYRDEDGDVTSYDFEWQGGGVVGISYDLLRDHNPRLMRVKDLDVWMGPYHLKIFDHKEKWCLARRII